MFKKHTHYRYVQSGGHWTGAPPSYHDNRRGKRPSSEPSLPAVFAPETPSNTVGNSPPYLAVMSAMRAAGYGFEDIHHEMKALGFDVSLADCRRFVIPKARRPRMLAGANRSDPGPISNVAKAVGA